MQSITKQGKGAGLWPETLNPSQSADKPLFCENKNLFVSQGDIRLQAINLLTAITDHDPNLSPFNRADIEKVIAVLEWSMNRDLQRSRKAPDNIQTPILDPVFPVVR